MSRRAMPPAASRSTRASAAAFAVLALAVSHVFAADPVSLPGRVDAVTVYRGQALVTRVVDLPNEAGLHNLIVTDLPAGILPGSVFAEVDGGAEVRHVRPRTRAVQDDVREDVRKLDEELAALGVTITEQQSRLEVLSRHTQYLDKLEGFTAPTANTELTRGVLNADTLQKLTGFLLAERERVAKETLDGQKQIATLNAKGQLIQRQRNEITGRAEKVAREAVLTVHVKQAGAKVRLKYLVANASWSPSYTIHAATGQADVDVRFQAIISQMSGEDWADVKMTLSTATPSVVARAPELDALKVMLAAGPAPAASLPSIEYARSLADNRDRAVKQFMGNSNAQDKDGQNVLYGDGQMDFVQSPFAAVQRDNLFTVRKAADDLQKAELVLGKEVAAAVRDQPAESVTVTYILPETTSLPSRQDQQLVGITSTKMKGDFYKLAVPVLTSYVYNEAQVVNASKQLLLAGPTMSYLDGAFVGAGELPTVAAGESFTAGFGIDSTLRVSRELTDKNETTSGGNKITAFDYVIRIENFGDTAAGVRVLDRIPLASGRDLKVTLVNPSAKPVDDAEAMKKKGQLRWDVEVKPMSIGNDATKITYGLSIEHDRNLNLVGQ
jgi:Domain of unknown function (DUF4139)/N-terminal domain of unknown function (DUF4140)